MERNFRSWFILLLSTTTQRYRFRFACRDLTYSSSVLFQNRIVISSSDLMWVTTSVSLVHCNNCTDFFQCDYISEINRKSSGYLCMIIQYAGVVLSSLVCAGNFQPAHCLHSSHLCQPSVLSAKSSTLGGREWQVLSPLASRICVAHFAGCAAYCIDEEEGQHRGRGDRRWACLWEKGSRGVRCWWMIMDRTEMKALAQLLAMYVTLLRSMIRE